MNGLKYPREWEHVNGNTQRLRIPKGWLVRTYTNTIVGDKFFTNSEALQIVEDKEGHWVLEKS